MALKPIAKSAGDLYKALPVPARVGVAIIGVLAAIYLWYFVLGLVVIAAFFVGIYHLIRWLVTR